MKTRFPTLALALLLVFAGFLCAPTARAGVPQPSYTLYGLASDEFGWPYLTNATVTLYINNVSNRTHVVTGLLSPGVNFRFDLSLDSGFSGARYYSKAARAGDIISVVLVADGLQKTIVQSTQLPPVGRPGQTRAVNLTAGTDSDGDGLPDEWERWIIENANDPRLNTIFDVTPEGDADGDGVSNIDEYRAGTDPANASDYLYLERSQRQANGRMRFEFLSIPGKTYAIYAADLSPAGEYLWEPASYAPSTDGAFQTAPIIGTGHFITIFTESSNTARIFKAQVR